MARFAEFHGWCRHPKHVTYIGFVLSFLYIYWYYSSLVFLVIILHTQVLFGITKWWWLPKPSTVRLSFFFWSKLLHCFHQIPHSGSWTADVCFSPARTAPLGLRIGSSICLRMGIAGVCPSVCVSVCVLVSFASRCAWAFADNCDFSKGF